MRVKPSVSVPLPLDRPAAALLSGRVRRMRTLAFVFGAIVAASTMGGLLSTSRSGSVVPFWVPLAGALLLSFGIVYGVFEWSTRRLRADLRSGQLSGYEGRWRIRLHSGGDGPDYVLLKAVGGQQKLTLPNSDYVRRLAAAGVSRRGWIDRFGVVHATPHAGLVIRLALQGLPDFDARRDGLWR